MVPKTVAREDGRCLATVAKEARRGGDAAGPLPASSSRGFPQPRPRTAPGALPPGWEVTAAAAGCRGSDGPPRPRSPRVSSLRPRAAAPGRAPEGRRVRGVPVARSLTSRSLAPSRRRALRRAGAAPPPV